MILVSRLLLRYQKRATANSKAERIAATCTGEITIVVSECTPLEGFRRLMSFFGAGAAGRLELVGDVEGAEGRGTEALGGLVLRKELSVDTGTGSLCALCERGLVGPPVGGGEGAETGEALPAGVAGCEGGVVEAATRTRGEAGGVGLLN